ncbi:MAG: hypothetical protein H6604_06750 [Flavobacteriales bacterium]|nr:hypothetical protein [Flavobacteriales bacterium]
MKKYIFFTFVTYWILAIGFAVGENTIKKTPFSFLLGTFFPRNYNMFVEFPTRKGEIVYTFYNDKDTLIVNGTESLQNQLKNNFPNVGSEYLPLSSMDYDIRVIDHSYLRFHWKLMYGKEKFRKKEADSIALQLNNQKQNKLVCLFDNYKKLIIKNEKIDTTKYNKCYFEVWTEPILGIGGMKNTYFQELGKQKVLTSK